MSLQDLTDHIEKTGTLQSEKIRSDAKLMVEELESKARSERNTIAENFANETAKIIEQTARKVISTATQEGKLSIEKAKSAILESVYAEVVTTIVEADDATYKKFLTRLAKNIEVTESVVCEAPRQRQEITKSVLTDAGITISKITPTNISAGFILSGNTTHIDASLTRLLKDIRTKNDVAVAKILFG